MHLVQQIYLLTVDDQLVLTLPDNDALMTMALKLVLDHQLVTRDLDELTKMTLVDSDLTNRYVDDNKTRTTDNVRQGTRQVLDNDGRMKPGGKLDSDTIYQVTACDNVFQQKMDSCHENDLLEKRIQL